MGNSMYFIDGYCKTCQYRLKRTHLTGKVWCDQCREFIMDKNLMMPVEVVREYGEKKRPATP